MSYEAQIEMLTCSDNKQAYNALKELLLVCEHSNDLYIFLINLLI